MTRMWIRPARAALAVLLLAGGNPFTPALSAQPDSLRSRLEMRFANGIAAVVEERIITVEEVRREIAPLLPQIRLQARTEADFERELERVQNEVIQSLVDRILLVKEFDKKELRIPPSFIENEFDEALASDFEGDRARFLGYLRDRGITTVEFRRELEERIKVGYMRQQMAKSQSVVSPVRIERFYSENRERFVQEDAVQLRLIRLSQIADEGEVLLEQTAQRIIEQLTAGTPFADLARKHSQDARAKQGGDWGWIQRASLQPALAEVAFGLTKGQWSAPVRLGSDIFILLVEDRRFAGPMPLEQVRPEIERILVAQMMRESQERMLSRLRERYFVRLY